MKYKRSENNTVGDGVKFVQYLINIYYVKRFLVFSKQIRFMIYFVRNIRSISNYAGNALNESDRFMNACHYRYRSGNRYSE